MVDTVKGRLENSQHDFIEEHENFYRFILEAKDERNVTAHPPDVIKKLKNCFNQINIVTLADVPNIELNFFQQESVGLTTTEVKTLFIISKVINVTKVRPFKHYSTRIAARVVKTYLSLHMDY